MNETHELRQDFVPKNPVEARLLALHEGRLTPEDFIAEIRREQLFLPVLDDSAGITGFQKSDRAQPLVVEAEGGVRVLILFTSPERAKAFTAHFPGFDKGGILVDLDWILARMEPGIGISINPDWEIGYDLEPFQVEQLKASTGGA
ncbi:MAG: SseB family protein [Gammaproteobacteria bacterium]|nr:MAG: SseB family protein [Gammaproteobacteria bacterium]